MTQTVLVSGGSGYIAGFLIRQLIGEGWTVHTTVRRLTSEGRVRELLALDDAAQSRLKFFAADLGHDAGWVEAARACSHVAHVASPVPAGAVKDPEQMIADARDGALRALRAARTAGVRRFVLTSSVAAICGGRGRGIHHFTEADWTPLDGVGVSPYGRSKTIAERAAREWVASQGGDMEFLSINPAVCLGPVWSADYSPSVMIIQRMLDGSLRGCPDLGFGIVDVRDVADLHVRALRTPGLANERFIASGPFMKLIEIARLLQAELGAEAARVRARPVPDWIMRGVALFDAQARSFLPELGSVRAFDVSHARDRLGWQPRPVRQTILDAARSLIALRAAQRERSS